MLSSSSFVWFVAMHFVRSMWLSKASDLLVWEEFSFAT
jgi:hypothetical protein